MGSRKTRPVQSNDGRRMYVFATVALATFVLGIVVVGYAGHGFVTPPVEIVAEEEAPQPAADEAPVKQAAAELETAASELKAAQHTAEQEYLAARQASAEALTEYEGAQRKFLDFVGSHFGELTADIPVANTYMSALAEQAAKERERAEKAAAAAAAPVAPSKPPMQKMVANPEWAQLRDQLEQLQQQRKKLLDKLTPSHPAVVSVDFDITDVEQNLQTVPAQIAQNVEPSEEQTPVAEKTAIAEAPPAATLEKPEDSKVQQPAAVPAPAVDLAAWAARWGTDDSRFHELADQLNASQEKYRQSLQHEGVALGRQADAAAAVAMLPPIPALPPPAPPKAAPEPAIVTNCADPRRTILWCGGLAAVLGLIVAKRAGVTEPVFRAAAAVRKALELPVLGILSRGPSQQPREQPQLEPRWVRRTVLSAELWIAAVVLLLAATALADQQFWRDLLSDPLAACSRRFF